MIIDYLRSIHYKKEKSYFDINLLFRYLDLKVIIRKGYGIVSIKNDEIVIWIQESLFSYNLISIKEDKDIGMKIEKIDKCWFLPSQTTSIQKVNELLFNMTDVI